MANFPVKINGRNDLNYFNETESEYINLYTNSTGTSAFPTAGAGNIGVGWKTVTPPTGLTSNTWYRAGFNILTPNCGRKLVINKITINTTGAAQLGLFLQSYLKTSAPYFIQDSGITAITNINSAGFTVRDQPNASGGETVFDFTASPLIIRSGQKMDFYYTVTGTTGINWQFSTEGYDICNDDNFDAPYTMLVLGDSICGFTTDPGATQYSYREDGTITGSWPYILQEYLRNDKIDTRQINLGIGGTNAPQWDYWINNGRISTINADLLFINLGMNDATTAAYLSTTAGVDGIFKKSIKNIVRAYYRKNPKGSVVINNNTDTDITLRLTTVSTGMYSGQTQLNAYRAELVSAVADMTTANTSWDIWLAPTNTAYTAAQTTYFVQPQTAGTNLHPNTQLGQPAMAVILYNSLKSTNFWKNHHG